MLGGKDQECWVLAGKDYKPSHFPSMEAAQSWLPSLLLFQRRIDLPARQRTTSTVLLFCKFWGVGCLFKKKTNAFTGILINPENVAFLSALPRH